MAQHERRTDGRGRRGWTNRARRGRLGDVQVARFDVEGAGSDESVHGVDHVVHFRDGRARGDAARRRRPATRFGPLTARRPSSVARVTRRHRRHPRPADAAGRLGAVSVEKRASDHGESVFVSIFAGNMVPPVVVAPTIVNKGFPFPCPSPALVPWRLRLHVLPGGRSVL